MQLIFNVFLLGFAIVASVEQQPPRCSCDQLRQCLVNEREKHRQQWNTCHDKCKSKLPNTAVIDACLNTKHQEDEALWKKNTDCLSSPTQGACVSSRPRRQISSPSVQGNSITSFDSSSRTDQRSHGHMIEALKPFHQCMEPCMQIEPERGYFRIVEECKLPLQCAITSEDIGQANQKCNPKNSNGRDERIEIGRRFCECVRNGLNKTVVEMSCQH